MSGRSASGDAVHPRVSSAARRQTSLERSRVLTEVDLGGSTRTALLIAPPGTGKTTLLGSLAECAERRPGTVTARYQAPLTRATSTSLLRQLVRCWRPALGKDAARIRSFEALLHAVGSSDAQFYLFVDDAHRLTGQSAADRLNALLTDAPGNLYTAVASRTEVLPSPSLVMTSTPMVRLGYDELRFRADETAQLFAEVYRRPLPPDAAAELCARTEGWATALRMFDVEHRLLDDAARSRAVAAASAASPLMRDHLQNSILRSLPGSVQDFMVQTCQLGVLGGRLCDAFLGRSGSSTVLRGLAESQSLVFRCGGPAGGYYRYHALLQDHLERLLVERMGTSDARRMYCIAAELLAERHHWPEAYRAFAHAEDWAGAARTLRASRARWESLSASAFVPAALLRDDPWVALANARRLRGNGQLGAACEAYREAEQGFHDPRMRWRATVERVTLSHWLDDASEPVADAVDETDDLSRYLRAAIRGEPARLVVRSEPELALSWRLVQAFAAALDGRIEQAQDLLEPLAASNDRFVSLAGRLAVAVLRAISRSGSASAFGELAAECEAAGWLWLSRLARAAIAVTDESHLADAIAVLEECRRLDDDWGRLLAGVAISLAVFRAGDPASDVIRDTMVLAQRLDAVALQTWLRSMLTAGQRQSVQLGDRMAPPVTSPVSLHCFGHYEFLRSGVPLDTSRLRRQARTVLWLLSLNAGRPVPEETLTATIWPEVTEAKAKHRLHVAISSLRRALDPDAQPRASNLIVRVGPAYALNLAPGSRVDLLVFEKSIRHWRMTRSSGSVDDLTRTLSTALDVYRGDLLIDAGQAEWILAERDRLRTEAANAAAALAALQLDHDEHFAIEVCTAGLRIDELHYRLWQLLAEAHARAGDRAAAARARQAYLDRMSS